MARGVVRSWQCRSLRSSQSLMEDLYLEQSVVVEDISLSLNTFHLNVSCLRCMLIGGRSSPSRRLAPSSFMLHAAMQRMFTTLPRTNTSQLALLCSRLVFIKRSYPSARQWSDDHTLTVAWPSHVQRRAILISMASSFFFPA